jgi:speckle-type POZ protein
MSPAASASAIVADSASGYHHLKIEGYLGLSALPNGHCISSAPFTVGGRRWRIDCYPSGDRPESAGYVSVFLVLDENVAGEVTAVFRFSFKAEKPWTFFLNNNKPSLAPQPYPAGHNFTSRERWGFKKFVMWEALEESRHLKHDSFTIRCDVVVVNGHKLVRDAGSPAPNVVLVPPSDLNQHMRDLLDTGKGADVVFEAGGETFAAHRCVLAARSPVFSAELFGSMKEGSTNNNDLVRIDGIEAQVFKALLCFLYTDSLLELMKEEEGTICQHLLVAADTYSMERLKLICEDKLCKHINVGTVANILALAEARHCHVLKSACFGFLGSKANLTAVLAAMASCISKQAAPLL